jgi:apolipoprotein N-acyltransferase
MKPLSTTTRLLLVLLSGAAMALAFPKFDVSLLAWVALIPLLYAVDGLAPGRVLLYAWLQGWVCFIGVLYWAVIPLHSFAGTSLLVAVGPMLLLAAVEAIYGAIAVAASAYVKQRLNLPWLLILPLAWTGMEWVRGVFPVGFPWGFVGYTAYRNLSLIQFAEFTGVYGISALIIFFNAVVYTVLCEPPAAHRLKVRGLSVLTALMVAALVFGTLRIRQLAHTPAKGTLKVAMVQGDIPQSIKWDPNFLPSSFSVYVKQSEAAAKDHPDVIIWPEAAAAFYFEPDDMYPRGLVRDARYRQLLLQLAQQVDEPLLFGAPAFAIRDREIDSYNRAYLVSGNGRIVAHYDKIKLAPFAEYVPGRAVLGYFVNKIVVGMGEFVPGERQTLFEVAGTRLGILICYEGIFPDLARRAVKEGADILVNITNDAWYGDSSAPFQLLAMSALRSVETHTPMVRVANTGISAVILPDGQITARTALFARGTEIESVAWRPVRTVYTIVGDVFAQSCLGLSIVALLLALFFRRRQPKFAQTWESDSPSSNGRP